MAGDLCRSISALVRCLLADQRAATAVVYALGASAVFGMLGLATEGGTWYLEKRHGQNAADAAAFAGVVALANGQNATTSATQAAALTGDTSGLSVTTGTFSNGTFSPNATPASAVKVVVSATQQPMFSGLFLSGPVTITESAVAALAASGPVCMLAGRGGLSFGGSSSVAASGCTIASNKTGSQSISGASSSHVPATQSLVAAGGCSGCTGLTAVPLTYQPPTPYPANLTAIEALTLPTTSGTQCNNSNTTPVAYSSTTPPTINCNGFKMTGSPTVNLTPGTYIFYNSSISLNNGTLECTTCTGVGTSGVTIIMTGNPASSTGTIDIKGNVTVNLVAPATNTYNSAFNGVLFYTNSNATAGNTVNLTGTSSSTYSGAMYFPSSALTFIGNSGGSVPTCTETIGYSMNFTGNSGFNVSGCSSQNVAQTQTVQLAQ